MDLFGMLGIPTPVVEEPKKKQTTKKAASKKPEAKKEETYSLPLTIVTGWHEPQELTGTETLTEKKLREKIHEMFPEYTTGNMVIQLSADKKKVYVGYGEREVVKKGTVEIFNLKFQCALGGEVLVNEFEAEAHEIELTEIQNALEAVSPVFKDCAVVYTDHAIVPVFTQPVLTDRRLSFPINVLFFGRGIMQVTKEQYADAFREGGSEWDEADGTVSAKALSDIVLKQYPDMDARFMKLLYDEEQRMVLVTPHVPESKKTAQPAEKKEETFPTEDVTLSVIFQKLPLDPSLFGGKKKVPKSELQAYVSGIFPEYSGDNVDFVHHKDKKLIVPVLRGSRKGAL